VGWSANLGSYANALAWWDSGAHDGASANPTNYFGISAVAGNGSSGIPLAPSGGPYNSIWGSAVGDITGLNLAAYTAVPEPATFALAGLGAAALVIFRRRK